MMSARSHNVALYAGIAGMLVSIIAFTDEVIDPAWWMIFAASLGVAVWGWCHRAGKHEHYAKHKGHFISMWLLLVLFAPFAVVYYAEPGLATGALAGIIAAAWVVVAYFYSKARKMGRASVLA